jgi:hypothetical protein
MLHASDVARSSAASNSPTSQMVGIDVVSANGASMVRIAARPTGVNTCHLVDLGMIRRAVLRSSSKACCPSLRAWNEPPDTPLRAASYDL